MSLEVICVLWRLRSCWEVYQEVSESFSLETQVSARLRVGIAAAATLVGLTTLWWAFSHISIHVIYYVCMCVWKEVIGRCSRHTLTYHSKWVNMNSKKLPFLTIPLMITADTSSSSVDQLALRMIRGGWCLALFFFQLKYECVWESCLQLMGHCYHRRPIFSRRISNYINSSYRHAQPSWERY